MHFFVEGIEERDETARKGFLLRDDSCAAFHVTEKNGIDELVQDFPIFDHCVSYAPLKLIAGLFKDADGGDVPIEDTCKDSCEIERGESKFRERFHRQRGDAFSPVWLCQPVTDLRRVPKHVMLHVKTDTANCFSGVCNGERCLRLLLRYLVKPDSCILKSIRKRKRVAEVDRDVAVVGVLDDGRLIVLLPAPNPPFTDEEFQGAPLCSISMPCFL